MVGCLGQSRRRVDSLAVLTAPPHHLQTNGSRPCAGDLADRVLIENRPAQTILIEWVIFG